MERVGPEEETTTRRDEVTLCQNGGEVPHFVPLRQTEYALRQDEVTLRRNEVTASQRDVASETEASRETRFKAEGRSVARQKNDEVNKDRAHGDYTPNVRSPELFTPADSAYCTAKETKIKKTNRCPEEQSTEVRMKSEATEAKTKEQKALNFASSGESEIDEAEVSTSQRHRTRTNEVDAKASATRHSQSGSGDSARRTRRRQTSSSTSASRSRGRVSQSTSRSESKENRHRCSSMKSKSKTKSNDSTSELSSSSDKAEENASQSPSTC